MRLASQYCRSPLFKGCLALYIANQAFLLLAPEYATTFQRNHFNDVLTMPVMFPVMVGVQQLIRVRPDTQVPNLLEIIAWWAAWSFMFEWLFPVVAHQGTADWYDVLSYAAGIPILMLDVVRFRWTTQMKFVPQ